MSAGKIPMCKAHPNAECFDGGQEGIWTCPGCAEMGGWVGPAQWAAVRDERDELRRREERRKQHIHRLKTALRSVLMRHWPSRLP